MLKSSIILVLAPLNKGNRLDTVAPGSKLSSGNGPSARPFSTSSKVSASSCSSNSALPELVVMRMTASFILFEFNSSWSIVVKQGLYCASKEGDHSILPARVAPSERSFNAPTSSNWISSRISFVRSSLFPLVNRATSRCLVRASSCYAASNSFALTTHFRHQETLYATSCSSVHCMCFSSAARSSFGTPLSLKAGRPTRHACSMKPL